MSRLPVSEMFQTVQPFDMEQRYNTLNGVKANMPRQEYDCFWCDDGVKKLWPSERELRERVFCSEECRSKWLSDFNSGKSSPRYNSEEIECQNCGDEFTRWLSQIERYDNHFCSKDCHTEWRTGNEAAYTPKKGYKTSDIIDHSVRSGWELGVVEMFVENGIDYEYEPQMFEVDGEGYIPDFIVDDTVVEVKGRESDGGSKVEKFNRQTDKQVVVIGADLDVDERFTYSDKDEVLEVLT